MPKYKVGDVAALFSKPKDPTTDSGKKLQSLFQDFYGKKSKPAFQPSQNKTTDLNKNSESNTNDHRVSKKGKKRKFSSFNDSQLNTSENDSSKKFKESPEMEKNKFKSNEEKKEKNIKQQDFPRKKFKKSKLKSFHTGNAFSKFEGSTNAEKNNEPYAKEKNNSKGGNKRNMSFMQKSKYQNISSANDSNNNNLFDETSLNNSDTSIRKEVEEFLKNNSENTLKIKDNGFKKKAGNWKEERDLKKSKLKTHLSTNENNSAKNVHESFKHDESIKNNENRKSTFLNQQDFPRNKKTHKANSLSLNPSFPGKDVVFGDDLESPAKSKKIKPNKSNFKQDFTSKVLKWKENAITKLPNFKSEEVLGDNSPLKYNHEIKNNAKNKQGDGVRRKLKKKKTQKKNFNIDDTEKSEELSNGNVFSDNADGDIVNTDMESNKKKFNNNNQTSQKKIYEETAPDFIKLSSPKKDDKEVLSRTLFVGNLPVTTTKKALRNLFSTFGEIEHVRCQGIETDKAKIFSEKTNKLLSFRYAADSVPGFVVFKDRQSAVQALSLSGSIFKDHHITVDFAQPSGTKKLYDYKRSIFVGNLPFDVKDESVWNAFMECGKIEAVRAVRDHATGIGKGFGYVLFSTVQAKQNALALNNLQIDGRKVRVKAVNGNKKTQKLNHSSFSRDTFKSRAIKFKKRNTSSSRKTIKKLTKKEKTIHKKKKIASILQKSMK